MKSIFIAILILHMLSIANCCSELTTPSIEDSIKMSHLVVTARISASVTEDEPQYRADLTCVLKSGGKQFHNTILITQIGTIGGGLCFENKFVVNHTYVLFLRELAASVYKPYREELPLSELSTVTKECEIQHCVSDWNGSTSNGINDDCYNGQSSTAAHGRLVSKKPKLGLKDDSYNRASKTTMTSLSAFLMCLVFVMFS